jgi:glutaredoxin
MKKFTLLFIVVVLLNCGVCLAKDLVIVGADWCPSCVQLKRFIDSNTVNYEVEYIDYDSDPDMVKKLKVTRIPMSFIFDDNNKLQSKKLGFDSSYKEWLKNNE